MNKNIHKESMFMSDEARVYDNIGPEFAAHGKIHHGREEYVRGMVHTNTIEGYYSIFKRGMKGVYQHCAEHHLHRYLAEFGFRYSNRSAMGIEDNVRSLIALKGARASA